MPTINTINTGVVEIEGLRYPRIFVAVISGLSDVRIVNIYDTSQEVQEARAFDSYTVDGVTYANRTALLSALQPVLSSTVVQAQTLAALTDVNISALGNNHILQYDSTAGEWENRSQLTINNIQSTAAMFMVINSGFGGVSMVSAGTTTYTVNADNVDMNGDLSLNGDINNVNAVESRSGTGDPGVTDIPAGYFMGWFNTTASEFRIWYNNAGTMISSAAFS